MTNHQPPITRTLAVIAAVAVMAAASGCNGDDSTSSTVPDIPVPETTQDTMFVTTTTTLPSTTQPTTTTGEPTTTPSTTEAATTVATTEATNPGSTVADQEVQAVVDAAVAAWTAFNEIKLDPLNNGKLKALVDTHQGELLDGLLEIVEALRVQNQTSIPNPTNPGHIEPFPDTTRIDGTKAEIEYCWLNSDILVEIGGNDDGSDLVVDDSVSAVRVRETYIRAAGRWQNVESVVLQKVEGASSCDAVR